MYNYETSKIIKLLNDDEVKEIQRLLSSCKRSTDWVNGNGSFRGVEGTKSNVELHSPFVLKKVRSMVVEACNRCKEYTDFVLPRSFEGCIVSKTSEGGYYNTHTDCGDVGDFSTTIFLSDKDSYEGGELSLLINGKEQKIKLNPGYCVVYPTGTPHRVNKVTSGDRYAFVFWVKCIIRDQTILDCCRELRSIKFNEIPIEYQETMEEGLSDIKFKVDNTVNRLMRRFGEFAD